MTDIFDDLDDLDLDDLNEEELAELEKEFDTHHDLLPANFRPREEVKGPMFKPNEMVHKLDKMMKKRIAAAKPIEKIAPTKTWKNTYINQSSDSNNNTKKKERPYMKKNLYEDENLLTAEDEELFDGLDEDDMIELAGLTDMAGLATQEQLRSMELGEKPTRGGCTRADPVKGPERRLMSMSDDEADLDTVLFMEHLREDTDDLFSIRINNVPLEDAILTAIFDALKTTTKIKHLCLAGVGMKDELGLKFNAAVKENATLETLNLESNDLTNETIEPLCTILQNHDSIREFKCSHQKHGLGSRGEEAMARALDKNERLLKIAYPFKVQSARSLADRCQIRNGEILRQKRQRGEEFYKYKDETVKRDKHPQPWIKDRSSEENRDAKLKRQLSDQKGRMKTVPNVGLMRAESKLRAKENAKPTMDDELASKLQAARKSRGRAVR